MIDLHCHLLPGIDDGAPDMAASLAMARMAVKDGTTVTACTPHILPGVYNNSGPAIRTAIDRLREALAQAGIELQIVSGADVHVAPDLIARLRDGQALTLNDTRYFLLEPPHHVPPPRLEDHIFGLQAAGYVPILTHPERLSWVEGHYGLIKRLVYNNVLMQLTAGSLMGRFGRQPRYWAERMLGDGLCHLVASDAHNLEQRVPRLSDARELVARHYGDAYATTLFVSCPQAILNNVNVAELMSARQERQPDRDPAPAEAGASVWNNLLKKVRRAGGD